jgi:hypothetical protein
MATIDFRPAPFPGHALHSSKLSEDRKSMEAVIFVQHAPQIGDEVLSIGKRGGELRGVITSARHTSPMMDPDDMYTITMVPAPGTDGGALRQV